MSWTSQVVKLLSCFLDIPLLYKLNRWAWEDICQAGPMNDSNVLFAVGRVAEVAALSIFLLAGKQLQTFTVAFKSPNNIIWCSLGKGLPLATLDHTCVCPTLHGAGNIPHFPDMLVVHIMRWKSPKGTIVGTVTPLPSGMSCWDSAHICTSLVLSQSLPGRAHHEWSCRPFPWP